MSVGQKYLNDTVSFGVPYTYFSSVYVSDSGFYLSGMRLTNNDPFYSELLLSFVDTNGLYLPILVDHEPFNDQRIFGGIQDFIVNDRGNFIYFYLNCDTTGCYQRLKEITPLGVIVNDVKFDTLISSYNAINARGFNDIVFLRDSTYGLTLNCHDLGNFGTILFVRLGSDLSILDTIYFAPLDTSDWQLSSANIVQDDNGDLIISVNHVRNVPSQSLPQGNA